MRQILLSPGFQDLLPFFVVLVLILLAIVGLLAIRIMEVYNERKNRKLLEKLFNETDGGSDMKTIDGKTMFEQAQCGLIPTGASGNQAALIKLLGASLQNLTDQANGTLERVQYLATVRATARTMQNSREIVEGVDVNIAIAEKELADQTLLDVAHALGNEVGSGQNSLGQQKEPGADSTGPGVATLEAPIVQPEALGSQAASVKAKETPEELTRRLIADQPLRGYFAQYFAKEDGVNIDNGYSFHTIPKPLFECIIGHFRGVKKQSDEHGVAYEFLCQVQTERSGS